MAKKSDSKSRAEDPRARTLERLKATIQDRSEKAPAGSITVYDVVKDLGTDRSTAAKSLNDNVEAGEMKKGKYWNAEINRWLMHYWYVK